MEKQHLSVKGADGKTYPVFVGPDLVETALPEFVAGRGFTNVAIISNDIVGPLYGAALRECIPGSYLITVPDGEHYKNLDTIRDIYDTLLDNSASRSTLAIALGGGVIGDMAGFAASTFMRGIPFVQVPTTLLAMVDASIGGKTGVDLPQGKNLVGMFKDPLAVFADTNTLNTLPEVEVQCGLAEIVKAGLIGDPGLLAKLRQGALILEDLIKRAISVKIKIVEQDRRENGVRTYLNLGHTFGHALEQASGYMWRHGLAVAVGLALAARLSARLKLCTNELIDEIERTLDGLGLPTRYRGYSPDELWTAMQHDKKWGEGKTRFVLLEGAGKPIVRDNVPRKDVLAVMGELKV